MTYIQGVAILQMAGFVQIWRRLALELKALHRRYQVWEMNFVVYKEVVQVLQQHIWRVQRHYFVSGQEKVGFAILAVQT